MAGVRSIHVILLSIIVFFTSLELFVFGISFHQQPIFDEFWYVATARELINYGIMLHQEHPPLGKQLISVGMWVFGDNPLGWRIMSAVFGSLTLAAIFLWSVALFRKLTLSLWVTVITFFDQVLYVQARIAMLDIFVMAFCSFALAFFTFSLKERQPKRSIGFAVLMGINLGLAAACKWSGLFLLIGIATVALSFVVFRHWRVRFEEPKSTDFYHDDIWAAITPLKALFVLGLIPFLTYFATYIPQMMHQGSVSEFLASHRLMLDIMSGNSGTHPYSSPWFQWPAMIRPVWYLFYVDGSNASLWSDTNQAQAIVALANPAILIVGEVAIVYAAMNWISRRDMNSMIVTVGFFSQYLPWAANPKGIEFSYYFFPAFLCVGPALGLLFFRDDAQRIKWPAIAMIMAAGLCFIFFLPILTAHIGVSPDEFHSRIWFDTWR